MTHVEGTRRCVFELETHVGQSLKNMVTLLLEVALKRNAVLFDTLVIQQRNSSDLKRVTGPSIEITAALAQS